MEEYVVPIFLLALAGTTLSLGAWVVRGFTRRIVVTWWAVHDRATAPAAYWFWVVYHVAGLALVIAVAIATTLYFVLDAWLG